MRSLFLAVILCAAPLLPVLAGESDAPKIGVLRLQDLLSTCKAYKDHKDKIKKLDAEAQATAKGMDDQITRLESSLQLARGNRDKYVELQEQFETAKLRKTLFEKRTAGDLDRQHGTLIKAVFTGMRQNLAVYCKEKGIMLVLLAPDPDLMGGQASQVQVQLGFQTALYWDPSTDITDAFLAYLNQKMPAESLKLDGDTAPAPTIPEAGAK